MNTLFRTLIAASLMTSTTAFAENWSNKSGDIGIGANTTLGGTQGFQVRYGTSSKVALQATVGLASSTASVDDGDTISSFQNLGIGVAATYKVIKAKTAAGSLVGSVDYHQTKIGTETDSAEGGLQNNDLILGLGFQGEVFLAKKFSIHSKVGLTFDPYNGAEADAFEGYGDDETSDDNDYTGMAMNLSGGLIGGAGFTVWF
ncbi:MAG: hypothetical protein VX944_06070 [Myxococcota bacterium]|jgi:hypothetical protein|nr:hypothetical protein [Myxococcota bacterium]MEC9389625.1 hypothetical protein [Myxococcota bacterium]